jgi:hypothetical protein
MSKLSRPGAQGGTLPKLLADQCRKITEKLIICPLSQPFRDPVDDSMEGALSYYQKIKTPMDLNKVLGNLRQSRYHSVDAWKADVRLIWRNSIDYNGDDSFYALFAKELSRQFERYCKEIASNDWELWAKRIRKGQAKLAQYIEAKATRKTRP